MGDPIELTEHDKSLHEAQGDIEKGIWEGTKHTSTKGYRVGSAYYRGLERIEKNRNKKVKSGIEKLQEKFACEERAINPASGKPYGFYDKK